MSYLFFKQNFLLRHDRIVCFELFSVIYDFLYNGLKSSLKDYFIYPLETLHHITSFCVPSLVFRSSSGHILCDRLLLERLWYIIHKERGRWRRIKINRREGASEHCLRELEHKNFIRCLPPPHFLLLAVWRVSFHLFGLGEFWGHITQYVADKVQELRPKAEILGGCERRQFIKGRIRLICGNYFDAGNQIYLEKFPE